jgi:hypothetical protein
VEVCFVARAGNPPGSEPERIFGISFLTALRRPYRGPARIEFESKAIYLKLRGFPPQAISHVS